MLLLGIDLGTSSVKVSVTDAQTRQCLATVSYPEREREIIARQPGWAEQDPGQWWADVQQTILRANASGNYDPKDIGAIGIAYQMHGLVLVDNQGRTLRDAIIWCDSRAVPYGEAALEAIGEERCLGTLLNAPGNFTAAKLAWVKDREPGTYDAIYKILLPGDFISYRLTGEITTTVSALSEGVFWDFKSGGLSRDIMQYFGFDPALIPAIKPVFAVHGLLTETVARTLGLKPGIPVSYKAGDQPNNALSLNVMRPGEVAATAGTSGVIYSVTDTLMADPQSRVNTFAHLNHSPEKTRLGILLCINGCGIMNRWIRGNGPMAISYSGMNELAAGISPGSEGLTCLPFGNGAERMLNNRLIGAHFNNLDLNMHTQGHLYRAVQEGVAFSFRYGLDIMRENGLHPSVVKSGYANMFLSPIFTRAFVEVTGLTLELFETDGSRGAAVGAGIGAGVYRDAEDAFAGTRSLQTMEPDKDSGLYDDLYAGWKETLLRHMEIIKQAGLPVH